MLTVTEGRERTKDALSALCNQASLCLDKVITTHSSEFDHPVGGADQARTGLDLGLMPVESADTQ